MQLSMFVTSEQLIAFLKSRRGDWYLATPYRKYEAGLEAAHRDACIAAGWLLTQGVPVFCPIAHSHVIAQHAGIDPLDEKFWVDAYSNQLMTAAGIVVFGMRGWSQSSGVALEVDTIRATDRPAVYLPWQFVEQPHEDSV